jgi:phosphoribosyl-AMP cyclohydrolase
MLAWMNQESLRETLTSGRVVYWSRSRQQLWRKGDTSGQSQKLIECRVDCDQDCLLLLVDQIGVACHTGRHSCFYTALRDGKAEIIADVEIDPGKLYGA